MWTLWNLPPLRMKRPTTRTKAVDTLRQAILLDPQNVNLYLDFAAISSTHQSFQVGINVVNEGINLQPKAASLYFARGVLYVQLAEYDKAQADFETAYDLDPSQSLSAAAQGLAAVQQNDLDHALASVQEKLASKPNDPILLYLQADVLTQRGAEPGTPEFQTAMRSAEEGCRAYVQRWDQLGVCWLSSICRPGNILRPPLSARRRSKSIRRIRLRCIT